jgi:hypothetical protein
MHRNRDAGSGLVAKALADNLDDAGDAVEPLIRVTLVRLSDGGDHVGDQSIDVPANPK